MMEQAIRDFPKQFLFTPKIENRGSFKNAKKFLVCGMGGSNLTAGLLQLRNPLLDIVAHRDYGLPALSKEELRSRLVICASYSGNTEETIDSFEQARKQKLALVIIATGGKLLALAQKRNIPYVQLPNTGIQPRMALGFVTKAMLTIIGDKKMLAEATALSKELDPSVFEAVGRALAKELKGCVPVIYATTRNAAIAYNWKIKFNETGKIPAFYNVIPELHHNEMTGFDVEKRSAHLSKGFYFIFLRDSQDHPRNRTRMDILKKLYQGRGLRVKEIPVRGEQGLQGIFSSLILADWSAFYTAEEYGLEAEQVPMVEEFKKLMAR